jgi:hypothetical protein
VPSRYCLTAAGGVRKLIAIRLYALIKPIAVGVAGVALVRFGVFTTAQLCQGELRIRALTFGLRNVLSQYSMYSTFTVPNVVWGFFMAERV